MTTPPAAVPAAGGAAVRAPDRAGLAALGSALAAACLLVSTWTWVTVVVAGQVMLGWAVAAGLLVAAVGLLVSSGLSRRRQRRSGVGAHDRFHGSALDGRRTVRLGAGVVVVVTTAGVLLAAAGHLLTGVQYRTLAPSAPGGCRVLVQESSLFTGSRGKVYALQGGSGLARHVGSYDSGDYFRPVTGGDAGEYGSYSLSWNGDTGALRIASSAVDVGSVSYTVTC